MITEKEKALERKLVKEAKDRGGWCLKLLSQFVNGLPDRLLLLPGGQILFVELKTTGEKPRRIQEVMHKRLRDLGFEVYVVDSSKKIKALFNDR